MKKLALLTALALSINCFACFAASAEETTEPAEPTAFSYETNFNSMAAAGWSSQLPDPANWTIGQGDWSYAKVDDEHGMSFRFHAGGAGKMLFKFPAAVSGEARLSFDLYLDKEVTGAGVNILANSTNFSENGANSLAQVIGQEVKMLGNSIGAVLGTGEWHRVDLMIISVPNDINPEALSTSVQVYFDGKYKETRGLGNMELTGIGFRKQGQTGGSIYMDNFSASYPRGTEALVASMNSDGTKITFNRTIDRSTIPEDAVAVKAISLVDGTEKNVAVTAEANVSATALDLIYSEPMESTNYKYVYTLSDSIKGIFGETLANTSFEYTTDVDYYINFNAYNNGDTLPTIGRAGIYDISYDFKDKASLPNKIAKSQKNTASDEGNVMGHMRALVTPKRLTTGKYVVSFDFYKANAESYTYLNLGDMTIGDGDIQLIFFDSRTSITSDGVTTEIPEEDRYTVRLGKDWFSANRIIGKHAPNTWKHYDFLFDFDNDTINVWQDGVKSDISISSYKRGLDYIMFASGDDNRAIQNLHMRNLYTDESGNVTNKNIVTTTLDGTVAAGTTTAKVTFRDPINPELITADKFTLTAIENLEEYPIEVSDVTPYGATLTFAALQKDVDYSFEIKDIKDYMGQSLSARSFEFIPTDMHRVTDIYASANGTKIESVSAWNNTDDITITATLESSRGAGNVYVVAAGYDASNKMIGAGLATLEVNGSGSFSANLGKLDLTGATSIRYFAIDSMENLAPLTDSVISIN